MDPCVCPVQLDSENSGKDQSEPCPFSFGNQDMFGVSGASQTLPSPLSQSLLLRSLSLERVKVRGASREGERRRIQESPQSLVILPWPFTCRNGHPVLFK